MLKTLLLTFNNPVMVLALAGIAGTGIAGIILADMSADTTDTDIICSIELLVSTLTERYRTCASIVSPSHPLFIEFKYILHCHNFVLVLLMKYE